MIGNRGSDSNFHFIPFLCICLGGKHLRYGFKSHKISWFSFPVPFCWISEPKDIKDCGVTCSLLVAWEGGNSGSDVQGNIIEVCDVTFSNITLNFSEPQTVLGYTFWNSDSDGNRFQWRVESDGSSGAFASVNIPNTGSTPTSTGFQNIADFQQKLPLLVTELKIIYDGLGGLESVRLCRSPNTTPTTTQPPVTWLQKGFQQVQVIRDPITRDYCVGPVL